MCGIAGFLHYHRDKKADPLVLQRMTDTLRHRGPDGEGYYIHENLALGHRRLAIIDTTTGEQPMASHDGRQVLVFNGEIYNYLELRAELEKLGHSFTTRSDTEVILAAYREWGLDCHRRFNGMWAFALWDSDESRLLISRDRLGEKPVYYSEFDRSIIFSSEIKGILAYGVPRVANLELSEIFLTLGFIPAPNSFIQGIWKLEPGHYLTVTDGQVRSQRYWALPEVDEASMLRCETQATEQFEWLLRDSVRLRMRSDVPFGAFLSGGLDSASIVALMAESEKHAVETFTIGFPEKEFDERPLARLVAERFRTRHHEGLVQPDSLEESLTAILHHYDEPFGDSSAIPTGYVSRYARERVKMVLTGDGGDEVLSGYNGYQSEKFSHFYRQAPPVFRGALEGSLGVAESFFRGNLRFRAQRYIRLLQTSEMAFAERIHRKAAWAGQDVVDTLVRPLASSVIKTADYLSDLMGRCPFLDGFYQLMYYNFRVTLPEQMLVKVDRMSMRHSLEARIPFLDHRLVEFMAGVHKNVKMPGVQRKSLLRNSVAARLPSELLRAGKRGFVVPLRHWFRDAKASGRIEALVDGDCPLDMASVRSIVRDHQQGFEDYGNFLWMLLVYVSWFGEPAGRSDPASIGIGNHRKAVPAEVGG